MLLLTYFIGRFSLRKALIIYVKWEIFSPEVEKMLSESCQVFGGTRGGKSCLYWSYPWKCTLRIYWSQYALVCKAHGQSTLVYETAKNDSSMPLLQMIVSGLMKTLFGKVKIYSSLDHILPVNIPLKGNRNEQFI